MLHQVNNYITTTTYSTQSITQSRDKQKKIFVPSSKKEGIFSYATSIIAKKTKLNNVNESVNLTTTKTDSKDAPAFGERKQIILRAASNRLSYFSRRGNQPRRERNFRKHFWTRAILYKKEKKRTPVAYFPSFFYVATPFIRLKTRRRGSRRSRLRQKVTFISRHAGERQGYLLFVKSFRNSSSTIKRTGAEKGSFWAKVQTQREFLFKSAVTRRRDLKKRKLASITKTNQTKNNFFSSKSLVKKPKLRDRKSAVKYALNIKKTNTSAKSLQETRNEMHRRAFSIYPGRWNWKPRRGRKKHPKRVWKLSRRIFYRGFDRNSYLRSFWRNLLKQKVLSKQFKSYSSLRFLV